MREVVWSGVEWIGLLTLMRRSLERRACRFNWISTGCGFGILRSGMFDMGLQLEMLGAGQDVHGCDESFVVGRVNCLRFGV